MEVDTHTTKVEPLQSNNTIETKLKKEELGNELEPEIKNDEPAPKTRKRPKVVYDETYDFIRHTKRRSNDSDESYDQTEENPFECNICRRTFAARGFLETHQRRHKNFTTRKFTCAICDVTFDTNNELKNHKHVHKDEGRVFLCNKCKHAYTDHCDYEVHILKHTNRSFYRCKECKMYFSQSSMLVHIPTHYDRSEECSICHKRCINLKTHMQSHVETFQCPECDKVFNQKYKLKSHLLVHTKVTPYQCLYCGRGFSHDHMRKNHTYLHTGEKPYQCKVCKLTFTQRSTLSAHMVTHETEKKYECEYCQKTFFHKSGFVLHTRSHTGVSLYDCPQCDKKSATKQGLRTHLIHMHTTEKPFSCDLCNVSYKTKQKLKRHYTTKQHKSVKFLADKSKEP